MMLTSVIVLIVSVAFSVWIRIILGIICATIARRKNRSRAGWFFGGFFLGLIGLILIICLSQKNQMSTIE